MRALTTERAVELDGIALAAKASIQEIDASHLQQSIDKILKLLPKHEQHSKKDDILNASDFTYLSQHHAHDLLMALAEHWPGDLKYNPAHAIPMRLGVQYELDSRIIQATQVAVEADNMGFYESITKVFMSSLDIWQTFPDLRVDGDAQNTVLISLIKNQDYNGALTLVQEGAPLDERNAQNETALICAAQHGDLNLIQAMLQKNSDSDFVDAQGAMGNTALIRAILRQRNSDIIEALLQAGANPDISNALGRTAQDEVDLNYASSQINPTTITNMLSGYALIHAAQSENLERVQALSYLDSTTPTNTTDATGRTALSYASEKGNIEIATLLINEDNITSIDIPDENGCTALIYAAANGHTAIVGLLAPHTTAIDKTDANGRTALIYAAANEDTESVQALLSNDASANATDRQGHTALNYAQGNEAIIEILLASTAEEQTSGPDDKAPSPPPSITAVLSQRAGGGAPVAAPPVDTTEGGDSNDPGGPSPSPPG